jgi:hypothetical protein
MSQSILNEDLEVRRFSQLRSMTTDTGAEIKLLVCDICFHVQRPIKTPLKNIIIGHEAWVYSYDPKTKAAIITVENSYLSTTKERHVKSGAKPNDIHSFLLLRWCCASGVCSTRQNH